MKGFSAPLVPGQKPQQVQVVERLISVLSAKSLLLGKEELLKYAPDIGSLWKVDDVMIFHVTVSKYDLDQLHPAVRDEEVSLYSNDELYWRAPLQGVHLMGLHNPSFAPIRIDGPSGAAVQLWLTLSFKYVLSKEPHA